MVIRVELYIKEYELKAPFSSASGSLSRKMEFVLKFTEDNGYVDQFVIELPLSPSHGEMPEDIISAVKSRQLYRSKYFKNCLSYFLFLNSFLDSSKKNKNTEKVAINHTTLSIGQNFQFRSKPSGIIKVKASSHNFLQIKRYINKSSEKFIVDFNASLDVDQLLTFMHKINKRQIFGIEQPLRADAKVPTLGVCTIADETLAVYGYDELDKYGYNGFVLKPFATNVMELSKCVKNIKGYLGLVGSNVSGPIDTSFCNLINNYFTVRLTPATSSYFSNHPLNNSISKLISIANSRVTFSPEIFSYLDSACEKVANETFDFSELCLLANIAS